MSDDFKDGDWGKTLEESDNEVRLGFVRKVYGILAAQLTLTFGSVLLNQSIEGGPEWIQDTWYLYGPAVFLQLFVFCAIACCKNVARKTPTNYIFLGIFTICWTYILTFICSFYAGEDIILAVCFTAIITITLSIYACFTTVDMTVVCGPFLCMGLIILLTVQIICSLLSLLFFSFTNAWYPFMAGAMVIIYGIYILIDTQLIVGGGRHELSIDDYIIGAMILYIDIIMLFLYLLEIFGKR
jgi:FtsH-binding integral membrane protein